MPTQIRDPVHQFVSLRDRELRVLSTTLLQRLRGIRQLAMASLVYPGALHTRFDHTLGVLHVAGQMAEALRLTDDDVERVRLAALVHDVGHGPFSHVSEYALERYADRGQLPESKKREKIHELVTGLLVRNDGEVRGLLGLVACEEVACLLDEGMGEPILKQIVSGPLDADKQDYLMRDSYFCGVPYGIFDFHQLHRSLVNVQLPDLHHELMIKRDGVHTVEQFVLAKYYLTANVYRHKVRLITDQMIIRAIVLGIEVDHIDELQRLYEFDNTPEFAAAYAEWDDLRFIRAFGSEDDSTKCSTLLERLKRRDLLKRVFHCSPNDFKPEVRELLIGLSSRNSDPVIQRRIDATRRSVESRVADVLRGDAPEIDPDFVICHAYSIKSVREMSRNDEASILVEGRPEPVFFDDASTLFRSINEKMNEESVEVYAPVRWRNHAERNQMCARIRDEVARIIEEELQLLKQKEGHDDNV